MVTRLRIPALTSVHGVRAVYTALGGVEGVLRAEVRRGGAMVEHDGRATCERLMEAIAVAGFEVAGCDEERRSLPLL